MQDLNKLQKALVVNLCALLMILLLMAVIWAVAWAANGEYLRLASTAFAVIIFVYVRRLVLRYVNGEDLERNPNEPRAKPSREVLILQERTGVKTQFVPELATAVMVQDNEAKVVLTPYGKLFNDYLDAEEKANEGAELLEVFNNLVSVGVLIAGEKDSVIREKLLTDYQEAAEAAKGNYQLYEAKHIVGNKAAAQGEPVGFGAPKHEPADLWHPDTVI